MASLCRMIFTTLFFAVIWLAPANVAQAVPITFDFEGTTVTSPPAMGTLTSLTLAHAGFTVTIIRPESRFDIADLSRIAGASTFGARSINPFFDTGSPPVPPPPYRTVPFIANFSEVVSSVSIDMGGANPDIVTLSLEAFSGPDATGMRLGESGDALTRGGDFNFRTLTVNAPGIRSIRFSGGSLLSPNSVFYDNLRVNTQHVGAVPEPATLLMLTTGLAGVSVGARKRYIRREE